MHTVAGWKSLSDRALRPEHFGTEDVGWFRFPKVSPNFGTEIGIKRLKKLRSADPEVRKDAAGEFARHAVEFLPDEAFVTYMPSSAHRSIWSEPERAPALVTSAVSRMRGTLKVVELVERIEPVPSVSYTRIRNVDWLASTLEVVPDVVVPDQLYVLDDAVESGATFAAASRVLRSRNPAIQLILLAWVH